jgi:hypothetical protein
MKRILAGICLAATLSAYAQFPIFVEDFGLTNGVVLDGGYKALLHPDDYYMLLGTLNPVRPLVIEFRGFVSLKYQPTKLYFNFESALGNTNLQVGKGLQTIEMYNYYLNVWVKVDSRFVGPLDQMVTCSAWAPDFTGPKGMVSARVSWSFFPTPVRKVVKIDVAGWETHD